MYEPIITRIDIDSYPVRNRAPVRVSLGTLDSLERVLVKVHSSDGLHGLGEGCPIWFITGETPETAFGAARALGRLIIGKNHLDIEGRMRDLDEFAGNSAAKCAFDMALFDLAAKRANLPLYSLLGGSRRVLQTDRTVGIGEPESMAGEAAQIKAEGFHAIKVKLGTNRGEDVARIRAIRQAVGDEISLRIDANQGWDPPTAVLVLRDLEPLGIQYCEEPVDRRNNEGLRHVRQRSPIPIMADESLFDHHDAHRLASMGACDYFNIKLAKSGGIHNALKINSIAEGAGIRCMVGCMSETRLGLTAAAHVVSARPNIAFVDLDAIFLHAEDEVIRGAVYSGGEMTLPEAPGHGADFDPAFLKGLKSFSLEG